MFIFAPILMIKNGCKSTKKIDMQKVIIKRGELKPIAAITGSTVQTVIHALNFRHDSELTGRIRRVAIERGGKLMEEKI